METRNDDAIEVEVGSNHIARRSEVTISSGANSQKFDSIEGLQIGDVADRLQEILNIPSPRQTFVNGTQVRDNYVIKDGDDIEFVKPAGVKGEI